MDLYRWSAGLQRLTQRESWRNRIVVRRSGAMPWTWWGITGLTADAIRYIRTPVRDRALGPQVATSRGSNRRHGGRHGLHERGIQAAIRGIVKLAPQGEPGPRQINRPAIGRIALVGSGAEQRAGARSPAHARDFARSSPGAAPRSRRSMGPRLSRSRHLRASSYQPRARRKATSRSISAAMRSSISPEP